MNGKAINPQAQPKVLSLSPNGSGGVKIFSSMNLTTEEKIALLEQALEHIKGKEKICQQ